MLAARTVAGWAVHWAAAMAVRMAVLLAEKKAAYSVELMADWTDGSTVVTTAYLTVGPMAVSWAAQSDVR